MAINTSAIIRIPDYAEVTEILQSCCQIPTLEGWRAGMRRKFRYHKPDSYYEAVIASLVNRETKWIDIGGGKTVFPKNRELSEALSKKCKLLVGLDPSDNIKENTIVHRQEQTVLEDYQCSERFDLATFRMVAEHISAPESFLSSLYEIMNANGIVVLLTPHRWSPVPLASSLIPNDFHHKIIRFFSIDPNRLEEDVFPTAYLMNTRRKLADLFDKAGFDELDFAELPDCTVIQRFRWSLYCDLLLNKTLSRLGLKYPERNLLGIYRRRADTKN